MQFLDQQENLYDLPIAFEEFALLIPLGGFGSLQLLENLVTNFAR